MKFLSVAVLSLVALSSTAQQKFGHVDSESLFYSMPEVKTIQTQLQTKSKEYENQSKVGKVRLGKSMLRDQVYVRQVPWIRIPTKCGTTAQTLLYPSS